MNWDAKSTIAITAQPRLTDRDFQILSEFIHDSCGIKMSGPKRSMLEMRLKKRLLQLNISSFAEYCKFVLGSNEGAKEIIHMIDAITTNKTDFFREANHFHYLCEQALPELIDSSGAGIRRALHVWSAGCSTGEEPYTLAMVLNEFAEHHPHLTFNILATDICTKVLEKARQAVYDKARIETIPDSMKKKYLLRAKDANKGIVRIIPSLRANVTYRRLNFMDKDFGLKEKMDVIFCRNVIIYFERSTQEKLLRHFCDYLAPEGYIFVGHSETLHGLDVPLVSVAPTIYRRVG
ncbi:MAG: protein-glutamate O-methyltransferase CheR [Nitrospirae bacterium]|nr:protein-glutamate O-methyltransferase CheR [Nitrospirota bacterium]